MRFLHVSGKLHAKDQQGLGLLGNGNVFCKLCNVKLAYNNFTGAMRNHIQYRHVCVSLEASQSQMSIMSCHTLQPVAAVRDPIRAVYCS